MHALQGGTGAGFRIGHFDRRVLQPRSLKGRPTLLIFWAPWCNVCQRDLPHLSEFYQRDKPAQLGVVSIGFADTRTNVEQFVKERPERSSIQRHTTKTVGWRRPSRLTPLQHTCYWMLKEYRTGPSRGRRLQNPQFRSFCRRWPLAELSFGFAEGESTTARIIEHSVLKWFCG